MSRRPLYVAAGAGLLHAAVNLYWAAGGTGLLATVGPWAVQWSREAPGLARTVLLVVAVGKISLALGPLVRPHGRLRALWWAAGIVLTAYGALNSAGAWAVLTGLVGDRTAADPAALWGHAALWDPLFLLWGVALLTGLAASRRGRELLVKTTTTG